MSVAAGFFAGTERFLAWPGRAAENTGAVVKTRVLSMALSLWYIKHCIIQPKMVLKRIRMSHAGQMPLPTKIQHDFCSARSHIRLKSCDKVRFFLTRRMKCDQGPWTVTTLLTKSGRNWSSPLLCGPRSAWERTNQVIWRLSKADRERAERPERRSARSNIRSALKRSGVFNTIKRVPPFHGAHGPWLVEISIAIAILNTRTDAARSLIERPSTELPGALRGPRVLMGDIHVPN